MAAEEYRGRHRKRRGALLRTAGAGVLVAAAVASAVFAVSSLNSGTSAAAFQDGLGVHPSATTPATGDSQADDQERLLILQDEASEHADQARIADKPKAKLKPRPLVSEVEQSSTPAEAPAVAPGPVQTQVAAVPSPSPTPAPAAPAGGGFSARLLAEAETQAGTPYVWGGDAPGGFDCSGLIYWAAAQLGVTLPRDTFEMLGEGVSSGVLVPVSDPVPGDLAFFGSGHVELVTSTPDTTFGAQQPGKAVGFNTYYPPGYEPTAYYAVS